MWIDFVVTLMLQSSLWGQVKLGPFFLPILPTLTGFSSEHPLYATLTQEPLSNALLLGTQPKM